MEVMRSWAADISLIVAVIGILLEFSVSRFLGRHVYDNRELLLNMLANLSSQIGRRLQDAIFFVPYVLLVENFALFHLPFTVVNFILAFICFEFSYYWVHRMRHRVALFWAEHSVHHQPEHFNLSVGMRLSFFHRMTTFWISAPLAVLGFDVKIMLVLIVFEMVYQLLIHTQLVKSFGPLDWVLNSPSHHRVHHGRNAAYVDKNFGGSVIVWDRLFGTYAAETEPVIFGVEPQPRTNNLIELNLYSLRILISNFRRTRGFRGKLLVLFGPPRAPIEANSESIAMSGVSNETTRGVDSWMKFCLVGVVYFGCLYLTTHFHFVFRSLGFAVGSTLALGLIGLMTVAGVLVFRLTQKRSELR